MSTVPSGTRFIGISENVNLTERKSAVLNAETQPYTIQDLVDTIGTGAEGPQGVQGPAGPIGPVGPAGLNWQGSWVSGTSYVADDAVGYDGASWFCILATSGTTAPDVDTTHWALLASQGAQGIQGVQGPTGAQGPAGGAGTLQQTVDNGNTFTASVGGTPFTTTLTNVSIKVGASSNSGMTLGTSQILCEKSGGTELMILQFPSTFTGIKQITLPNASGTVALVDYKVYSALISQSAGGAPTAKVLKNTTGATFTYSRNNAGSYTVTASSNVFTANKTASVYSLNTGGGYSNAMMNFWYAGATFFFIETLNEASLTDGIMIDTFIEIRIYN